MQAAAKGAFLTVKTKANILQTSNECFNRLKKI